MKFLTLICIALLLGPAAAARAGAAARPRGLLQQAAPGFAAAVAGARERAQVATGVNGLITLRIRNGYYYTIWVAVHYRRDRQWRSHGFWQINPGGSTLVAYMDNRTFYYSARTQGSEHVWQGNHCWYVRGQYECMREYYTGSGSLGADPGETFTLTIS